MPKSRKLLIVDLSSDEPTTAALILPETRRLMGLTGSAFLDYGRNLDTISKARAWLTDQRNWFPGQSYIIKWDGIIPKVCANHGQRLINEPFDDGLPHSIVISQRNIREGKREKEEDTVPPDVIG